MNNLIKITCEDAYAFRNLPLYIVNRMSGAFRRVYFNHFSVKKDTDYYINLRTDHRGIYIDRKYLTSIIRLFYQV